MKRSTFFGVTILGLWSMMACNTPVPSACIGTNIAAGIISLKDTLYLSAECSENAYSYTWDFGDGSVAEGLQVKHLYTKEGVFTVKMTATSKNKTKSDEAKIVFSVQK